MDETYIKANGAWKYLYRAVDKQGQTIDFLLTARRDAVAARRFLEKAIRHNTVPDKVTMDKSGANQAALEQPEPGPRSTDHDSAGKIPQQHCRAGSPRDQTHHAANAQFQIVLSGARSWPASN